jgi:hypothetical protein
MHFGRGAIREIPEMTPLQQSRKLCPRAAPERIFIKKPQYSSSTRSTPRNGGSIFDSGGNKKVKNKLEASGSCRLNAAMKLRLQQLLPVVISKNAVGHATSIHHADNTANTYNRRRGIYLLEEKNPTSKERLLLRML